MWKGTAFIEHLSCIRPSTKVLTFSNPYDPLVRCVGSEEKMGEAERLGHPCRQGEPSCPAPVADLNERLVQALGGGWDPRSVLLSGSKLLLERNLYSTLKI